MTLLRDDPASAQRPKRTDYLQFHVLLMVGRDCSTCHYAPRACISPPLFRENSAAKVSRSTSRTGHMRVHIACRAHTLAASISCSRHPSHVASIHAVQLLQHPKVRVLDGLAVRGGRGFRFH